MAQPDHSTAETELSTALSTVGSFQNSIQHADTKVAVLLTMQGALSVFGASVPVRLGKLGTGQWWVAAVTWTLAALFTVSLVVGTFHLASALRPRLTPPGANRFAFPSVAASQTVPTPVPVAQERDEAWRLAATLARIAVAKHDRVWRAVPWILITLAAALAWTLFSAAVA